MKNILIPTDFSENSWNAIKYALSYLKKTKCKFYLFHVTLHSYAFSDEYSIISTTAIIEQSLLKKAQKQLNDLLVNIKKLSANENHEFETLSSYNFFIDSIKDTIKEKNIDLVIMGTKGASGLKEVIIGSNTTDLITQVKCPVLIVPENAVFKVPEKIVFPTDYNVYHKPEILKNITDLATTFNSTIKILHVAKKDENLTGFQIENKEFLHSFFIDKKHSFHKITNKKIDQGIQCFIESLNIDLIVMIAKNINLFQHILFKPTIEDISYHTEIPFLVLHE